MTRPEFVRRMLERFPGWFNTEANLNLPSYITGVICMIWAEKLPEDDLTEELRKQYKCLVSHGQFCFDPDKLPEVRK